MRARARDFLHARGRVQWRIRTSAMRRHSSRDAAVLRDGGQSTIFPAMDATKRQKLKADLSGSEAPMVAVERFFDGNEDEASIGCNLAEHPGIDTFRTVLLGLTKRPDVESVYALIAEVDPGEEYWPFTDTILVVGSIPAEELASLLSELEPDEVGAAEDFGIPEELLAKCGAPVLAVWWD
jgi:hypothetical protein